MILAHGGLGQLAFRIYIEFVYFFCSDLDENDAKYQTLLIPNLKLEQII